MPIKSKTGVVSPPNSNETQFFKYHGFVGTWNSDVNWLFIYWTNSNNSYFFYEPGFLIYSQFRFYSGVIQSSKLISEH